MGDRIIVKAENALLEEVGEHSYSIEGELVVTYKDGDNEILFTYTKGSRHINCSRLIQCTRNEAITALEKMYYYHDDLKGFFNV